jgi:hypothetical protein
MRRQPVKVWPGNVGAALHGFRPFEHGCLQSIDGQLPDRCRRQRLAFAIDVELGDTPPAVGALREARVHLAGQSDAVHPDPTAVAIADSHGRKSTSYGSNLTIDTLTTSPYRGVHAEEIESLEGGWLFSYWCCRHVWALR